MAAALAAAAIIVGNLTTEYRNSPLAVDIDWNPRPRFAWQVSVGVQSAYRVSVATSDNTTVWDSGTIGSSQNTQISYNGTALQHDTDYFWMVYVTVAGYPTPITSGVAMFGTGLDSAGWASTAVWLAGCSTGMASPQLRKSFSLDSNPITRARAHVTGVGLYSFHVNGQRAGNGSVVLTPGWSTVPTQRVLADSSCLDDACLAPSAGQLVPGQENVVGLRLGQGKYGYVGEFCPAGDATCYAGVVYVGITQRNGVTGQLNTTIIATSVDGSWSCAPSPITYNSLFNGESYNASLESPGWDAPNFVPNPAIPWIPATTAQQSNVSYISPAGNPITVMNEMTPVKAWPGVMNGVPDTSCEYELLCFVYQWQ